MACPHTSHAQDYTTGLSAHWTFDEGAGSSAGDSSGNGNIGTLTNGPTWGTGIKGGSVVFDGTDDYIDIGDGYADFTTGMTIAMWAKPTAVGSWARFIEFSNGPDNNNISWARDDTYPNLTFFEFNGAALTGYVYVPYRLETNVWHHYVATIPAGAANATVTAKVYMDGELADTGSLNVPNNVTRTINYIARSVYCCTDAYFQGEMDDVRLYSRELSAADVAALYQAQNPVCTSPDGTTGDIIYNSSQNMMQYCNNTGWVMMGLTGNTGLPSAPTSGLVAHWKLDDAQAGPYDDAVGSLDCTVSGSPTSVTGMNSSAINFNTTGYGTCGNAAGLEAIIVDRTKLTWGAWLKRDAANAPIGMVSNSVIADPDQIAANFGFDEYAWCTMNGPGGVNDEGAYDMDLTGVNDGNWHMLTCVYDGSLTGNANRLKMYFDGVPVTLNMLGTIPATIPTQTVPMRLGVYGGGDAQGAVDDARIYNRALTAQEVSDLFLATNGLSTGLVGHWRLDETSGTSAADSSGNGYNGTMVNGLSGTNTATGQVSTSLTFDNNDDYISVADNNALDLTNFTLSTWIYPNTTNEVNNLFEKGPAGGPTDAYFFVQDGSSNELVCGFYDGGTWQEITASYTVAASTWTLLTCTYDNTSKVVTVYSNGVAVGNQTLSNSPIANTNALVIGRSFISTDHTVNGRLDDVRVYNRALTDAEVVALYTTSTTGDACASAGEMNYNSTTHQLRYCNGSDWIAAGPAGNGGAGCTGPTGTEGDVVYNTTHNTMQYCEGDTWVAMGSGASAAAISGLIGHWKLDETTGSMIVDQTGNNYGGWYDGSGDSVAQETIAGKDGTALDFNGSSDVIDLYDHVGSRLSDAQGTISAWVKPASQPGQDHYFPIYRQRESSNNNNYNGILLGFYQNGPSDPMYLTCAVESNRITDTTTAITLNTWYHVAVTWSGTTMTLYLDGVAVETGTKPGTIDFVDSNARQIGWHRWSASDNWADGVIDDVRIYNRDLTAQEIDDLYVATGGT